MSTPFTLEPQTDAEQNITGLEVVFERTTYVVGNPEQARAAFSALEEIRDKESFSVNDRKRSAKATLERFDTTQFRTVHPLLRQPNEVSIASRDKLIDAYHDHISSLTNVFETSHDLWTPPFPVTVSYYSDNGGRLDDTAPKEIRRFLDDSAAAVSVLSGIAKPDIRYANTPAQAWVQGGFDLAQTTRHGLSGVGNVTFLNCAPRLDERGADDNKTNKGEPIYVGILPNGHVVSANSRHNFVFFKDAIESGEIEIFEAHVQPDGTQFRSRDIFPTHAVVLANVLTQNIDLWKPEMSPEERRALLEKVGYVDLEKPLQAENIPDLPQFTIANIDVHGNVKLNTRTSEIGPAVLDQLKNQTFTIQLNGEKLVNARFTERMFDRKSEEAGLSTGSSGSAWQNAANQDGFLELSIIGGDAAAALNIQQEQFKKPLTLTIPELALVQDNVQGGPAPELPHPLSTTGETLEETGAHLTAG